MNIKEYFKDKRNQVKAMWVVCMAPIALLFLMLALAAGEPAKGYAYPQHHPKVKFDESVLPIGAAVFAYAAMRWLVDHQ